MDVLTMLVVGSRGYGELGEAEGLTGGWPTQARFWLEWGRSLVTDLGQRTD